MDAPRRIHITGGPGGGKTTLSRRLAALLGTPLLELDGQALNFLAKMPLPVDYEALIAMRESHCLSYLAANDSWVTEGTCIAPYLSFFEQADVIVCLDIPWRLAGYRILMRHLKAEIARNNRFPGLGRLLTFWLWSARYYGDRNPPGLNQWGTPATRACLADYLSGYESKLVICRSTKDIAAFMRRLELARDGRPVDERE